MDISILEPLAKVAGLGGLSIGTLVLIFRAIIKLDVFQRLNQIQTYKTLDQIIKMTFFTAILGLILWAYSAYRSESKSITTPADSTANLGRSVHIDNSNGRIGNIINGDHNTINNESNADSIQ